MGIGSEQEVEEFVNESVEIIVEIKTSKVAGGISCGELGDSRCGVGDAGGDSDKRGVGSIIVGR